VRKTTIKHKNTSQSQKGQDKTTTFSTKGTWLQKPP